MNGDFMKKLFMMFFSIFVFFAFYDSVYASIDSKNAELECIYANGIVIGLSYDQTLGKNTVYVKDYPVSKTSIINGDPVSNISFVNPETVRGTLMSNMACPEKVYYATPWERVKQEAKDGDKLLDVDEIITYRGVYSFVPISAKDFEKYTTKGWWIFSSTTQDAGLVAISGTNIGNSSTYATIPLVGERVYLIDDIGDGYGHTYKLKTENEQAVGSAKYAQIYRGKGWYFIQVGRVITSLIGSSQPSSQYLCIKPSVTTQESDRGEAVYKFSSKRHTIYNTSTPSCGDGYLLYERTTESCNVTIGKPKESFCDKYSNTAFVLIDIIKIMQILVPAVVIIFTGFEIGKIVIAGNIEEELPKRKKSIFIRLVVMVAFFLLPVIVQLIISLAEGVSILDVSCLFNNGVMVDRNEDLTDDNCVDDSNVGIGGENSGGGNFGPNGPNGNVDSDVKTENK